MHSLPLLATSAMALTARAFLLPPNADVEIAADGHATAAILTRPQQTLALDCADCRAAVGRDAVVDYRPATTEAGVRMQLEMAFAVRDGALTLNGQPVYPPARPNGLPVLYTAKQIISGPADGDFYAGRLPLSLSIDIKPTEVVQGTDGVLKMHPISIEALGLGNFPVHVPTIQVKLAEVNDGQLLLLPLETTPYNPTPATAACSSIMCRARAVIAAKLAALKAAAVAKFNALRGCHRKIPGAVRPHLVGGPAKFHAAPLSNDGLHRGHPHHHHHHGHHRHGHFRAAAGRMLHHVLLPILLGVFTGAFVGAVALFAFAAVRALVRRVRGQRDYVVVVDQEAEEGRASAELPPRYEDAYVEPADDVADEKKELLPEQKA